MAWKSFDEIIFKNVSKIITHSRGEIRTALVFDICSKIIAEKLSNLSYNLAPKSLKRGILTIISNEAPALSELRFIEAEVVSEINKQAGYTAVIRLAYSIEIPRE